MASTLRWLSSIPLTRSNRWSWRTVYFYDWGHELGVSIGNSTVSGNLKVTTLVVFLFGATIDKTLGDIDNKYWTRGCGGVRLETARQYEVPDEQKVSGFSLD